MAAIQLIAKSTGQVTDASGNNLLSLARPCVVKIAASPEDVKSISRNGDSLVVRLKNGEVITINNFFHVVDGVRNDLVMEDPSNHQLWLASYSEPWTGAELVELGSIDELIAEQSDDHNAVLGLLVPGAGFGAIGIGNYLASRGGSGGGSKHKGGAVPDAPEILFNNLQGLTGTAEPGSLITLTRPDGSTATTTTDGNGHWSFLPNPLDNGQAGEVTASNGNGPSTPTPTGPADLIAPKDPIVTENNADGLAGTGEPGDTITLHKPDGSTVTTTVDENGNWSFPENPLGNGEQGTLVETDPAGNHSGNVDTGVADLIPPTPPVITENNGNGLGGTGGEPGDIVTVTKPDGSTATTTVDGNGNWEFPENPLGNGESGEVTITDPAGNVSPPTETGPADTIAPEPPVVTENNGDGLGGTGEPGGEITVHLPDGSTVTTIVDENGNWEFPENPLGNGEEGTVTVTDPAGNISGETPTGPADLIDPEAPLGDESLQLIDDVAPITGTIAHGGKTNDDQPTFSGKVADANDVKSVNIYDNGVLIGSAAVDAEGNWTFTPDDAHKLAEGPHNFQAASVDAAGNESAKTADWNFTVDTQAPTVPVDPQNPESLQLLDDVGAITGPIAKGGVTDDARPEFKGDIGPGSDTVLVNIYDNGELIGSAAVDANGQWSFTPSADLGEGPHSLQAAAVDGAGNESGKTDGWDFSVDLTAPNPLPSDPEDYDLIDDVGLVTGSIARDSVTDDTKPTFEGKGAGSDATYVFVYDNGQLIGTTTVNADGSWSFTPSQPLHTGEHNFQAAAADAAGNVSSERTPDWKFSVDVLAPDAPSIQHVVDDQAPITSAHLQPGSLTDDRTPTVSGTSEPGNVVHLYVNGNEVGSVVTDAEGNWSITTSDLGADGSKIITAQAVDAAGQQSPMTGGFEIILDTTAPTKPEVPSAIDNVGGDSAIVAGGSTDDTTPTFGGSAEPGDTVTIKDGDKVLGTATVDENGNWTFTPSEPLGEGDHSITTVITDPAGNSSEPSDALDFNVDSSAVIVSITKALDDFGGVQADLADSATTDDRTPTLVGTANAGALVRVYEGEHLLGSVVANAQGQWQLTLPEQDEGPHHYTAVAQNAAGNEGSAGFSLGIDFTAPTAPGEVTITDNVGEPGNGSTELGDGSTTNDTTPVISGSGGEPGDIITIIDNGNDILGTAVVDGNGNWQFKPEEPLPEGEHEITVTATDEAGNVSEPSPGVSITVDVTPPGAMQALSLVDDVEAVTGEIAHDGKTNDLRPEFKGQLAAGDAAYVNVYDNGVLLGTATVGSDGKWSFTPSADLSEAAHNFQAEAVDAAGNVGAKTPEWKFTVDTTTPPPPQPWDPDQPEQLNLIDDVGSKTGTIAHGGSTDDAQPTFQGKLPEVGDIVAINVYDNGQLIGSAAVNADGTWSFTPGTDLVDGPHDFQAASVDGAGNESARTDSWGFTVDTLPPTELPQGDDALQLIDDVGAKTGLIAKGDVTDDAKPTFIGKGAPADAVLVNIYDNGVLIGSASVSNGEWSFEPSQPLLAGSHDFQAAAVDAAGNEGEKTADWNFTLKLNAPQAPSLNHVSDDFGPITSTHLQPGAVTDDKTPTVSGTAEPGTVVHLYVNGSEVGSVATDAEGNWSITASDLGADGSKVITAKAVDEAGQSSPQTGGFEIILDTTAPAKPGVPGAEDNIGAITGPITDGVTDDTTPTFSGTSEPGATVTIKDGDKVLGTATVGEDGNWSFTPSEPLAEGEHSITTQVTDPAGNVSEPSDALELVINTQAVSVSVLKALDDAGDKTGDLANNATTDDSKPTLVGTATAGALVTVMEGANVLGSVVADATGHWTLELPQQADGAHSYSIVASNGANSANASFALTVDTLAPSKPGPITAIDDQGDVTGPITGGVTDDATPTLGGSAEPGSVITIKDGETVLGSTTVGEDGTWSFTPPALEDGDHAISVIATDPAGNVSEPSDVLPIKVDTSEVKVSITQVVDNAGSITGDIAKGGVTDDSTPTLHGKGVAGETVHVSLKGGAEIGTALVDAQGNWTFELPAQADGAHTYVASIDNGANSASAEFNLVIDTVAPAKPEGIGAIDDQGKVTGSIEAGGTTDDNQPTLGGKAEPGSTVTIKDGDTVLGTAIVDGQGNWSFTPPAPLGEGEHSITAEATDAAGNTSEPSDALAFTVDTAAITVSVTKAVDNVGSKTGDLSDKSITDDTRPTLIGTATAGAIVSILHGVDLLGTAVADASGKWSFELPEQADGTYSFGIVAKGANGNEASTGFELTIDTQAPSAPTGVTVTDNVGAHQGQLQPGDVTDDNAPVIGGHGAKPGEVITVYDNGSKLGTAIADAGGNWQYKPETPLADGAHQISASSTDAAGNESAQGPSLSFSVDTTPPGVSTDLDLVDDVGLVTGTIEINSTTDDARPQFSGRLAAGEASYVNVYDGAKLLGTATVAADGSWSFQSPLLEAGNHDFRAEAVDAAGNVGVKTPDWNFVVAGDNTQPSQPSFSTVLDDQGNVTGPLQKGDTTDDKSLTVQGTADANTVVHLYVDGNEVGSASVGADGKWSIETGDLGADGVKNITAQAVNDIGQESTVAGPYDIVLDTTAPAQPGMVVAADDIGELTGAINPDSVTDDNLPTFSGSGAETGATVTVKDGETVLGTAIVDESGNWSFTPSEPLGEGEHSISASVTDKAGNTSEASDPLNFTVDTSAVVVSILRAKDDVGSIQTDVSANGVTDDTTPRLEGTATANAVVTIKEGANVIGSTTADAAGNWHFDLPQQSEGAHTYIAVAKNQAGTEGSASFALTIDTIAPDAPAIGKVIDDVGSKTGELANGGFTDDQSPTLYGTSGAEGDLIKIYDNGELLGSVVAGPGGAWNWNPTGDTEKLSEGPHELTVTATDKAGNESAHSPAFEVNVDVTAPGAITDLDLYDDAGAFTGTITAGKVTDDSTPTYSGHVDPASGAQYVNIYSNGKFFGTATVNAEGDWAFTPMPMATGSYTFSAAAVDAAGNEGPRTDGWDFSIFIGGPSEPAITNVSDDFGPEQGYLQKEDITDDTTLILTGTGQAGATLYLYARLSEDGPGTLVGSALIDAQGEWEITTSDLSLLGGDGMKYLYAQAQDGTGQWSTTTGNFPIELYTGVPEAPELLSFVTKDFTTQVSGNLTSDTTPSISGKGEPGSLVTISDNGEVMGSAVVGEDGTWSYTPESPLADGEHAFTAVITDKVGNTTEASEPWLFVVDTLPPNVGLDINTAEQLAGQTEPGAIVTVVDKAGASHTVTADQDGRWSIQPNPLGLGQDGSISVQDAAGNQSEPIVIQGDVLASYDLTRYTDKVNTTESGDQANPSVTTLKDGKIVVVWQGGDTSTGNADSYMQLFEADGVTRIGGEQQVNQRNSSNQDSPQVVALADGGYLVVWESYKAGPDTSEDGIMARRYAADGSPVGDEFAVNQNTAGGQKSPVVVAHADGGYTISWMSDPDGSNTDLIVQRTFDAHDKPVTGDVTVGSGDRYGLYGAPAMDAFTDAAHKGMYVTVWNGYNGPSDKASTGVIGQLYKADGTPLGNNFQINSTTGNSQDYPDVITLKDGSFIVVWEGNPPGSTGYDVYMAHYSVNPDTGAVQQIGMGDERVNTSLAGDQYKPTAVALNDGGYMILWGSAGGDGSGSAVFAQRYSASGEKLGREFIVNPTTDGNQGWAGESVDLKNLLDATVMEDGNVYVTWQSDKADSSGWGIESTVVDIDAGYYSEFRVNSTTSGDQDNSATARLPNGGFVVVWESANVDGSGDGVVAQLYDAKGMPVGGEFVVNSTTANFQGRPSVAVLADGSFVVSWTSNAGGNDAVMQQKYGYTYDLDGHISGAVRQGGEYMVNVNDAGAQRYSSITALEDGGYMVTWKSSVGGEWHIYTRQYKADGSPVGSEQMVADTNMSDTLDTRATGISTLEDGRVVFSYAHYTGGSAGYDVYFRIYDPVTKTFGAEIVANQTTANNQASPSVTHLANGNFVVTWDSNDNSGLDAVGYGTWGRVFNAAGEPVSGEFLATGSTLNNQALPVVVAREGGGFVVIYQSQTDAAPGAGTYGIYAQYFDDAGHKVGQTLQINQLVTGDQTQISATFLDSGKLYVSWTDNGVSDGSGSAVKGRLVDLDETLGLTPPTPHGEGVTGIDYVPSNPPEISVLSVGLDHNSADQLGGVTEPGAIVTVVDGKGVSHSVTADEHGRWAMYPNPLAQGEQGTLSAHDGNGHEALPVDIQGAALADYQLDRHTVGVNTTESGPQANPSSATLADGKIIVVWQSGDTSTGNADVYMQLFAADGVTKIGTEQLINQRNANNQDSPQVIALADGGYLVVWESYQAGPDTNADGVMARRYGADGTPLTDEFLVNVNTAGGQRGPSAVAHADGSYTISWASDPDGSTTNLIVQRTYGADNKPLTGDVTVGSGDTYGNYGTPEMATFGDAAHQGMYMTVWNAYNGPVDKSGTSVIGQIFKADGTPLGVNFQVNSITGNSQNYPDVITLKDGTFIVVWEGNPPGSSGYDVYMAHYSVNPNTGAVQQIGMGDERVNSNIAGDQFKPTAVALNDGGYLVVWGSAGGDGSGSAVFAQRYSASGEKLGREFLVNPTTDGNQGAVSSSSDLTNVLDATLLQDGNVYVTWQSDKADSNSWGIQGTVIDIDAGYYSEFRVNSTTSGAQDNSATARLPNGGFVVVWESASGDGSNDCVMAQLYDAKGMPVGGEFKVNSTANDFQGKPSVEVLKDGSFVVSWTSYAGGNDAIMQQKYGYTYDLQGHINGAVAKGGEYMVNINDVGNQRYSNITALDDGGYIISWSSNTTGTSGKWVMFMRQYSADGTPVTGDVQVGDASYYTSSGPDAASMATLKDGTVVIAYNRDAGGAAGVESYFRIYDPVTKSLGAEVLANQLSAGKQSSPSVSLLSNGNFIVTWDSNDNSGLDQSGLSTWGRLFNAKGQALGNEFIVSGSTLGDQSEPIVVAREGGGFVVVYTSKSEGAPGSGTFGVYAQYFDDAGHKVGPELHVNQLVTGDQTQISATFLDSGKLFVSWTDSGVSDGSDTAVKGRLVDLDETLGLTPAVPEGGATHVDYHPVSDIVGTAGNDMLDARGYTTASGGEGNDAIIIDGTGFGHIDGGAGHDTLVWASHNPLNLAAIADKVENIESIHLTEGVSQLLTLTLGDLLKVTGKDANNEQTLKVTGDTGAKGVFDTVDIDLGAWSKAAQVTENNVTYDVYNSTSASYAHLLIQEGLHVV
ncbi:Ig-like domain-containing protein [Pseudomonas citronellolis]|nr:Ig-like domain-containing protein [Pseudomonas citronellolis]MDF3933331.1 Ig-like domain-containing protein [Pseudomonas citronellolis]